MLTTGIQDAGGTKRTIAAGRDWIERTLPDIARQQPVPMGIDELTVGTICGGSDATSGLTANPAMGLAFDLLLADGAKTIFEETGELIGMEHLMAARAVGYHSAFVRRPMEWGPSGPPDPAPNPAHDIVVDTFFDLAQQLGV